MKVLVTGATGYVGSRLVPQLLGDGHHVVAYDLGWFGDGFLPKDNGHLKMVTGDIRDVAAVSKAAKGCEAVIHMACVSNDPSCHLDPALSQSINIDAFTPMAKAIKAAGVRRFVYASSSSVYGVSDAPDVTEEHPLIPLTIYNASKAECEKRLAELREPGFETVILRPATVCGYAPRMRFDLTVNILTAHAMLNKIITVFGGEQKRPNLHIRDMIRCYQVMLSAPADKVDGETFNVGRQNMKLSEIAKLVQEVVYGQTRVVARIETQSSTDNRSYHVNSDKIKRVLGFEAEQSVEEAIRELVVRFGSGMWKDALTAPVYTNVKQLVDRGDAVQDSLAPYRKDRYAAAGPG